MKVAIYARVSTADKGQDVRNQTLQLGEFCDWQGWTIVAEYSDQKPGWFSRHQTDEIALRYIQDEGKIDRIRQTVDAAVAGTRTGTGAGKGMVDNLRQLAVLRFEGVLTDEEFTLAKARIGGSVTTGGYDFGYEKQNAPGAGSAMSANC